jgi:plastocyanin
VQRNLKALILATAMLVAPAVSAASTAPTTVDVGIVERAYQPHTVTVEAGDTVTWKNTVLDPHTVTADGGTFNSGVMNGGTTFSVTFTTPGTFDYSCLIHPTMHGVVVVRPAGSGAAGSRTVTVRLSQRHGGLTLVHVEAPRPGARATLELSSSAHPKWRQLARTRLSSTGKGTFSLGSGADGRLRVVVAGSDGEPPLISRSVNHGG